MTFFIPLCCFEGVKVYRCDVHIGHIGWKCSKNIVAQNLKNWNRNNAEVKTRRGLIIIMIVCAQRAVICVCGASWGTATRVSSVGRAADATKNAVTRDSLVLGLSSNTQMPTLPLPLPLLPPRPHPLNPPSAKLPHFNPIVCIELREMIFRRQWVPCREKKREGGLECVSEVALTPLLMESN